MTPKRSSSAWICCVVLYMASTIIPTGVSALEDAAAGRGAAEDPAHKEQRLIKAQEKGDKAKKAVHEIVDKGKKLATEGSAKIKEGAKQAIEKGKETTKKTGEKIREDGRKILKKVSDKAAEGGKKILEPVKRELKKLGQGTDEAPKKPVQSPQSSPGIQKQPKP